MNMLLRFVTGQRLLVLLGALLLVAGGTAAWMRLPIDAFPDVTNVQVMILTEAPGLSPVDVERQVTFPIEIEMNGLPRVREVRSLSKSSFSQVVVVFEDDVDIYLARQLVIERLITARERLPAGIEPELGPISTGLGEIYQYTLESKHRTPMQLRTLQDWVVAPQLRTIAGVNEVNSFGGMIKQYHVLVDPDALLKYGLALHDVVESLARNNANAGGGYIVKGWEQAYVRSVGLIRSSRDIEEIVLRARGGTPVLLREVAFVTVGPRTRQGAVTRDARGEAVAGMVIMLKGENSKQVVDRVRERIGKVQATLPGDVKINTFYDRTSLIEACINTVSSALLQGGLLVGLVLMLFLWNIRAAMTVAVAVPLTALCAFLLMDAADLTANLMSLGGLAIAVGMVVDGAVVVVDNIARHLRQQADGDSLLEVIQRATAEVVRPVLFAILIIIVVFVPLLTLEQMEGKMFRPLALTMVFAMIGSLLVALVIIPALASFTMRGKAPKEDSVGRIADVYTRLLSLALLNRRKTVAAAALLLAGALGATTLLGREFLPELDEGAIAINVMRLPSASLDGSVKVAGLLEQRLRSFPEVQTVVTKTGRAAISEDPMGPEQSDVIVMLKPQRDWTHGRNNKAELIEAMERKLADVPGIRLSFSQPIALRVNELISGIKSDVAIKLFGTELEVLKTRAEQIGKLLGSIDGAADVSVEQVSGLSLLEVKIDRRAIARYHLNIAEVNEVIETAVGGRLATQVFEGERRFGVLVRFPKKHRRDATAIGRILLPTPSGARVPLARVASIQRVEGPAQVSRQDGMRRVVIECNVRGRDLGRFVDELKPQLQAFQRQLPEGYRIDIGGQHENQQRAMKRLAWVVPLSIGLIFALLFGAFNSLRHAFIVLANLPFALIGGVVVVLVADISLSVPAVIGFIALFGLAVENGVVLVSFFNQLLARGHTVQDAVVEGCRLRLRPLLMTTATTLFGLAPMLWASGSGAQIQRPLAAVVLGGLASSTALTLVVLPVIYATVESKVRSGRSS